MRISLAMLKGTSSCIAEPERVTRWRVCQNGLGDGVIEDGKKERAGGEKRRKVEHIKSKYRVLQKEIEHELTAVSGVVKNTESGDCDMLSSLEQGVFERSDNWCGVKC